LPAIGRTHGVHAEPITFGLKFALWYDECMRNIERLKFAMNDVCIGKINGAVGTFEHLSPKVEVYVCKELGLKPALITNQVIQRDHHAYFIDTLAIIGTMLEKIATELRHLQRTEVLEAEEYFTPGQKGSSAMPHKRNPIPQKILQDKHDCFVDMLYQQWKITLYGMNVIYPIAQSNV